MTDRCKVLYIEDNIDNQFLLQYYIKNEPFDMTVVGTGQQALDEISNKAFDLFLVDLNLPGEISGEAVVNAIREDEKLKEKPIIVVTAFTEQDRTAAQLDLDVNEFITKPIRKADFLNVLKKYIR